MDITQWGECQFNDDYTTAIIPRPKSKLVYYVSLSHCRNEIK